MSRNAVPAPTSCSVRSENVDEPLAGSAPRAVAWLALEQPGPWGARALTHSHLDPTVGASLERAAEAAGVRPCLIRRPGPHADGVGTGVTLGHRVLVASTRPGRSWLLDGTVADPRRLLELDLAAVAAGDAVSAQRSLPELALSDAHHLLVCTNGTRDVCCAVRGRPVAVSAAEARPGHVWEVTHTSGHRFAPTSVLLPSGYLHGRLDAASAVAVLGAAEAGRLTLEGCRGRSTWAPAGQAAELAVRTTSGEVGLDAVTVRAEGDQWRVLTPTGEHRVRVEHHEAPEPRSRPESCGKPAVPVRAYVAHLD